MKSMLHNTKEDFEQYFEYNGNDLSMIISLY